MQNFKKQLAEKLSDSVRTVFENMAFESFGENDWGFYCDYDNLTLNPSAFSEVSQNLDAAGIDCVFELERFSGVYEDGDANKRMLQRIYVTAFPAQAEFDAHKRLTEEAAKRDHRILGGELKLFSHSNDIGQVADFRLINLTKKLIKSV